MSPATRVDQPDHQALQTPAGSCSQNFRAGDYHGLVAGGPSQELTLASDATLDMSATLVTADREQSAALRQGTLIGRYVVLTRLGAGAMGVVWAAYDPELDRKLAIKLLRPRGGDPNAGRARLQREAQALAKLDHHNVVTVHDVGVHGQQSFVAMEYVVGKTLTEWLAQPRAWKEVVRVFGEAGSGLAAAHAVGLVHRDFKPDNLMIGDDGRVRVMDFGLARAELDGAEDEHAASATSGVLSSRLTQTGALMGTPAYMSHEQFAGREVDARSDQFSFCVALYEALYGERPFAGETIAQLVTAVGEESIRAAPRNASIPSWLRKVVVRGLAKDPQRRWPDMQALLDALADDPAQRRRRWWAVAGLIGLLGVIGWDALVVGQSDARVCANMEAKLAGTWDDERRAKLEAAILATGLSYAPDTWARVERDLDVYTSAWVAARVRACEATHAHEQSGELLDLRMACLDRRLLHVRATVDELAQAQPSVVEKAVQAVQDLPGLERCADANALLAELPPPEDPELAKRVAALEQRLVEAEAKQNAGNYREGTLVAEAVVAEANSIDYEPAKARALLRLGMLQQDSGAYEAAQTTLRRALDAAIAQRMSTEAATAATKLVVVVGHHLARHEDGRRWAEHADPLSRAVGTDQARAAYFTGVGILARAEGKYAEAREHHEHALALYERALGPEHPVVAESLRALGSAVFFEGKYDEARRVHERALQIRQAALGPEHPAVAHSLSSLGNVAHAVAKYEEARTYHERAVTIAERALGPEHPDLSIFLSNLGNAVKAMGDYELAMRHYQRALTIREQALGSEHPSLANLFNTLGNMAMAVGDNPQARAYFARGLAIGEQALGPDHPELAYCLNGLGNVANEEKQYEEAREYQLRALAVRERALEPDHPLLATPLTGLGEALLGLGEPARAIPRLERALAIRSANSSDPGKLADTRFALARALWEAAAGQGRDRVRALEMAEQVRAARIGGGERAAKQLAEVDAWLAERRH